MSAHNMPFQLYESPFEQQPHKTTTGTLTIDRMFGVIPVDTTAGAAALTLAVPTEVGIIGTVILEVDNGDLTLTVTNGYNADADTDITFADAGDFVVFYSIDVAGTKYWRVLGAPGVAAQAKILLHAEGGAAESASGLLMGVGTTVAPATTSTADAKFIEIRAGTTATSGDNRLAYLQYSIGAAGGGECLRANTIIDGNTTTAHGAHIGLEFLATAGASECSGLGVAVRGTLMIPNVASWAPTGTYAAAMFEIFSVGSNSDPAGMTELSVLRLCNSGDATGAADVDDDAFLMSIQGFTTPGTWTTGLTAATVNAACTTALKIKVGATTHWIPVATAIT